MNISFLTYWRLGISGYDKFKYLKTASFTKRFTLFAIVHQGSVGNAHPTSRYTEVFVGWALPTKKQTHLESVNYF